MADRQTTAGSKETTPSLGLTGRLGGQKASLVFTAYQSGKLFCLGLQPDGRLSVFERNLECCMGLTAAGASLYQRWRFVNAIEPEQSSEGDDRVSVPQVGYVTGDLDLHDTRPTARAGSSS